MVTPDQQTENEAAAALGGFLRECLQSGSARADEYMVTDVEQTPEGVFIMTVAHMDGVVMDVTVVPKP